MSGSVASAKYQMLEISLVPCSMKLTVLGFEDDEIDPECVHEWDKMWEHLESPNLVIFNE